MHQTEGKFLFLKPAEAEYSAGYYWNYVVDGGALRSSSITCLSHTPGRDQTGCSGKLQINGSLLLSDSLEWQVKILYLVPNF